jgi:hypothetical protein
LSAASSAHYEITEVVDRREHRITSGRDDSHRLSIELGAMLQTFSSS